MEDLDRQLNELDDWEDVKSNDENLTILESHIVDLGNGNNVEFGALSDGTFYELDDTFLFIYSKDAYQYFKKLDINTFINDWCNKYTVEVCTMQDQKYIDVYNQSKLFNEN